MFNLVEKAFLDAIKQELCNIKIRESNNVANNSLELQDALQQVKKELAQVIVQKNKLHDLLELNIYTIDVFLDRNKLLDEKIKLLNNTINSIKSKVDIYKKNQMVITTEVKNVFECYKQADSNSKNALLKSIIESVSYYKENDWETNQFALTIKYKDL